VEGLFTADPNLDGSAKLIRTVERVDDQVQALAGSSWGDTGRGGMATKLEAAGLASASGVDVVIASGLEQDVLPNLAGGARVGTYFQATSTKMESRKRWMLSGLSTRGEVVVDVGASIALQDDNHSLLAAGVKEVLGSFQRGDIVSILDGNRDQIAAGIANYGSDEMAKIKGRHSDLIADLLGHHYGDEMVHRNNMVTL
jgi:glutamate 5-kinase